MAYKLGEELLLEHPAKYKKKIMGFLRLTSNRVWMNDPADPKKREGISIPRARVLSFRCKTTPPSISIEVDTGKSNRTMTFELTEADESQRVMHLKRWRHELSTLCEGNKASRKRKRKEGHAGRKEDHRIEAASSSSRNGLNLKRAKESDAERRSRLLREDQDLREFHKELVETTKVMTESEFWASREQATNREQAIMENKLAAGRATNKADSTQSAMFGGTAKRREPKKGVELSEIIKIFAEKPHIQKAYEANVPLKISEAEFWTRYFRADIFYRNSNRAGSHNSDKDSDPQQGSTEAAFFSSYKETKMPTNFAMERRKPAEGLDPRIDLRLSEGYERYAEEELAPLLSRDGSSEAPQFRGKAEKRRKMMSKYNRLGALVVNASEMKARYSSTPRTSNGTSAASAVEKHQSAIRQLGTELRFNDLQKARLQQFVPLRMANRSTPNPDSETALLRDHGDEHDSTSSLHLPEPLRNTGSSMANAFQSAVTNTSGALETSRFKINEHLISNPRAAEQAMAAITSQARGDEARRRDRQYKGLNKTDEKLMVYSTGTRLTDFEVDKSFATDLKKFANRAYEIMQFYWSCFPPKSVAHFKKLKSTAASLTRFQEKINRLKKTLFDRGQPALVGMLKPVMTSLEAVLKSQIQVEKRLATRKESKRRKA